MAQNRLIDVTKSTPRFPQLALGGLKSTPFGPKSSYRGQKATFVSQKSTLRCLISKHRSKIDARRPNSTLKSLASTLRCQSSTPTEPKISLTARYVDFFSRFEATNSFSTGRFWTIWANIPMRSFVHKNGHFTIVFLKTK